MLILTFEDREEEILNHIISYVSTGARAFQVIENAKTNLSFNGLEIDDINRSVRKQKQEIERLHRKQRRAMIKKDIQRQKKERAMEKQRAKREG